MNDIPVIMPNGEKAAGVNLNQASSLIKEKMGDDLDNNDFKNLEEIAAPEEPEDDLSKGLNLDEAADELKHRMAPQEPEAEPATEPEDDNEDGIAPPQQHPARRDIQQAATQWEREARAFDTVVNSVNWAELKQVNPGEFAARQAEVAQKRNELLSRAQAIQQANAQVAEAEKTMMTEHAQKLVQREHKKIGKDIPEWRDPSTRAKVQRELVNVAREMGYTDQEINQLYDARAVKALYQIWKGKNPETGKKIPRISLKQKGKNPETSLKQELRKSNVSPSSVAGTAIQLKHLLRSRGV